MSDEAGARSPPYALLVVGVICAGLVARSVPLWWSTLPATMDGFQYAALADATLSTGRLPVARLDADEGFAVILAAAGAVTGVTPLRLAQLTAVAVGAAAPLAGVALVRQLGLGRRPTWRAATVVGLALAVGGLFVRRTGVPDEEQLTLLLVPLLAIALARALSTRRPAHITVAAVLMAVLPALHNLATVVGLTTATALVALRLGRRTDRASLLVGVALLGGFWLYFRGYYVAAGRAGLGLTYVDVLAGAGGLFVAWLVLLVVGCAWYRGLSGRWRRTVAGLVLVVPFGLLAANLARPVFPGTIATPGFVLVLVAPLVVPAGLAAVGLGEVRGIGGDVGLALLAGPFALGCYLLSASLTPPFLGAVLRVQTYLHVPAFALAAVGAVALAGRSAAGVAAGSGSSTVDGRGVGNVALGVLLVAAVATAPVGHVDLDTGAVPSTAMESQYDAVSLAATGGRFATDDDLARIGGRSSGVEVATGPTRRWLRGGPPPACPLLAERSWTTTGAHLYPAPPETVSRGRFDALLGRRNVVYANTGRSPLALAVPRGGAADCGATTALPTGRVKSGA